MMKLHYHPLSTYSQKTLMAFHEKQVAFTPELVTLTDPTSRAAFLKINPIGKMPVLVLEDGWKIPESSIIIEYLDSHFSTGTRLIAEDKDLARRTRFHDRMADLYVNDSLTKIFFDGRKPEAERDPKGVAAARERLELVFGMVDNHLAKRTWMMDDAFSMADCALAPCLGYARMLHPFDKWKHLTAYAGRVMERPSFAKVHAEAAPYLAKL